MRQWTHRFTEIADGDTTWRFDRSFLTSNWTCIWGRGCLGSCRAAEDLGQGCCSIGADLDGDRRGPPDRAPGRHVRAFTLRVPRRGRREAASSATRPGPHPGRRRRLHLLNRTGFAGGAGCALDLAALDTGESPVDWKPSVCWQLPIKVDWVPGEGGTEVATVRAWTPSRLGGGRRTMAWCCTEGTRAYVGDRPVIESMAEELEAIMGSEVYVELRRRLGS